MTLLEFITARLDEDEATARAAGDGRWRVDHWLDPRSSCPTGCSCRRVEGLDFTVYDEGGHDEAQAAHIARHDPARVLREVEAKRALLALHHHLRYVEPLDAASKYEEDHRPAFDESPRYVGCAACHYDSRHEETYPSWWCDTVRLLALPYADHPDYRSEWSPDSVVPPA